MQAAIRAVRPSVYVDIASMGDSLPLPRGAAAALAADGARPLIFALTQPGALSPRDAYEATDGRCIFADRELVGAFRRADDHSASYGHIQGIERS